MNFTRAILVLPVAVISAVGQPAHAQSENDLQRQVDALKEQVRRKDIDAQTTAARLADLERRLAECEGRSTPNTPDDLPPAAEPTPSPAPSDAPDAATPPSPTDSTAAPFASPDALVRAARQAHHDDFGERANSTAPSIYASYVRELTPWVTTHARSMRREVKWSVRVESITAARGGRVLARVTVLDPSKKETGQAEVEFVGNSAKSLPSRQLVGSVVHVTGLAQLQFTIDPDLKAARPFRHEEFIGPALEARVLVTQALLVSNAKPAPESPTP